MTPPEGTRPKATRPEATRAKATPLEAALDGPAPPEAPAPGLHRAGARLPIDEYTRRLWFRRYFVTAYSSASNAVGYEGNFLGQAWQVLTPLLNIGVYYLIFGLLLNTNRGVPNFIGFLAIGVFVFAFSTTALTTGARAITGNLGLVRALQFPRAVLPVSTTLVAFMRLLYSLVVLVPILLISGAPVTLRWLELAPALGLQALFGLGLSFIIARLGAQVPDMSEILPFVTRMWMYTSGVMYSVQVFTQGHPAWVGTVMTLNPGYVYLTLARHALLPANPASVGTWLVATAWAVGTLVMGYLYFWRGEEEYGNV